MKVTKEPVPDIYTRKVTVEMTEAEWEYITGLAAAASAARSAAASSMPATRLANGSKPYWDKNLDYSRLFISEKGEVKYPFGELDYTEKVYVCGGGKIDAVKSYRNRNGCSLRDAKDAVDTYLGIPVY